MIKVKCIYIGRKHMEIGGLTLGKIYDVTHFEQDIDTIHIIDDHGIPDAYYIESLGKTWFENVTSEYREAVINEILE